ncbi:MAG: nuclease-related domain-containing protein [Pseudomonadota bacterium]
MADDRLIVEYGPLARHRSEIAQQQKTRRNRLLIAVPLGLILVMAAAQVSLPLAMLVGIASVLTVFFLALPGASSVDAGELAGVEGEVAVLKQLQRLPDEFLVLNRVSLPDAALPNGKRELDFIVAGPTGLWIIEVKNTPGHLRVVPEERHWPLARRAGCGSNPSWNGFRSPVPQALAQVEALKRWFLIHGQVVSARAAVVMAHAETAISDAELAPIPVLLRDQVAEVIRDATPQALPHPVLDRLTRLRG